MTYLWQMTLLGGICTLLLIAAKPIVLKKSGGKWYCGLWLLVLLAYVLPYKLVFFPHFVPIENTAASPMVASYLPEIQTDFGGTALPVENTLSTAEISFLDIQMMVYGMGLLGFFLYYLVSYIFLQMRIQREAEGISSAVLDEVQKELGIKRKIALKVDGRIQTPLFLGILKPTILLPKKSYDKEELYFLLCHELTHYKSRHMYLRLLVLFVHMIHWFNPLSYVALRQIQEACEYACDEGVTERMSGEKRLAYGYLLLRGACPRGTSVFSLSFGGNRKKDVLKRRITVIMEKQKKKKIQKVGIALLAVGTLAVCGSFFDLKPIYAGVDTQVAYEMGTKPQGFLWTDHVQTEKEAISLAKEYVAKVFHGDVKGLSVTAEYHDGKEGQPEGWLIRFISPKKTEAAKEYAIWLTKEGNTIEVRQSTFAKKTKEVLSEEAWQKLLEDDFWVTEGKEFVENSPWQKEKIVEAKVFSKEGQRKQEEVCVSVDTTSGATYILYFHPWKELSSVKYCPPAKEDIQRQNLESRLADAISQMPNVKQAKINMGASAVEGIPSVSITTKNQQPLTLETVTKIQKLVAGSLKGVEAEDISVYCNEKRTFSVKQGKDGASPLFLTITKDGTEENETLNISIEEGQPVLAKIENIPSGLPTKGKVSKEFDGKKHLGTDIDTNKKALPIQATAGGTVTEAKFDTKLGNYIVIDHGNGFVTKYAHNAKNLVKAGDTVEKGKEIALAGKTGMATGVFCHYEVWENGVSQNPNDFM